MDERDAKLQGLEVHKRTMAFVRGYVSCNSCGCNYHSSLSVTERVPTFCQRYSIVIDPTATEENIIRAESCAQWVHERLDRNMVVHPDHSHWYED